MSGFKLLAIRPMPGNPEGIKKNLINGNVYKFYNSFNYEYSDPRDKISELTKCFLEPKNSDNLYTTAKRVINFSAIVGKNGSGKSSIIELFYAACYSISVIDNKVEDINKAVNKKKTGDIKLIDNVYIYKQIHCQIYFSRENKIFRINLKNGTYIWEEYVRNKWSSRKLNYSNFAYSIAINYSLYGLNSNQHMWVSALFHKNDGYQIPVVINPFRQEGRIDVNSELHLAQSRILLNLSASKEDNPEIVNKKTINKVEFTMDICENDSIRITSIFEHSIKNILENHSKKHNESIFDLFNITSYNFLRYKLTDEETKILKEFYILDMSIESKNKYLYSNIKNYPTYYNFNNSIRIKYELIKYVIRKVYKICINYPNEFGAHLVNTGDVFTRIPPEIKDFKTLINHLQKDDSHITLKLRQALYAIKEKYFERNGWYESEYFNNSQMVSFKINIDWKIVKKWINNSLIKSGKRLEDRLELVPGAFVKPVLKIKNNETNYSYVLLSSGEQQLANTIHTIIYHLYNINSVHRSRGERIKYQNINIILDEIELYFHPEFQRMFINELVNKIEEINVRYIKDINILLATHSPFILSDIPNDNILRLHEGNPLNYKTFEETFGSNIHDLLKQKFFLENGAMGEFAKEKINKSIKWLNDTKRNNKDNDKHKRIINLIGEPILHIKLLEMYEECITNEEKKKLINQKISELKIQLKHLK